jgi:hypothetical protein
VINWLPTAEGFDRWRVAPRASIVVYMTLLWKVTEWFMTLPEPNSSQGMFVSAVWGAGSLYFSFYSGKEIANNVLPASYYTNNKDTSDH